MFWRSQDAAEATLAKSCTLYRQEWLEDLDTHEGLNFMKTPTTISSAIKLAL